MLRMGDLYRNGDGVDRDLREAAEWYSRSAQQGNKQAQLALAELGQSAASSGSGTGQ
jgi:TPR repeat protein